jgi:conjugal transfer pilus assembly protein TraW
LATLLGFASPTYGRDLGAHGQTFAIGEVDILKTLGDQLRKAEASGDLAKLQADFTKRVKAGVERPVPVPSLVRTQKPRSWLFDPSIIVPKDFADQRGRVFARQGDRINPLDKIPGFDRVLIFIDGDDEAQVDWAIIQMSKLGEQRTRLILVKGAPLELMRRRKVQVYFDQAGTLSRHFGLTQVPAKIEREGSKLLISEVAL